MSGIRSILATLLAQRFRGVGVFEAKVLASVGIDHRQGLSHEKRISSVKG